MLLYLHTKCYPPNPLQLPLLIQMLAHRTSSGASKANAPFPNVPQRSLLCAIARKSTQNPPTASHPAHNKALWSGHVLPLCPTLPLAVSWLTPLQPHASVMSHGHSKQFSLWAFEPSFPTPPHPCQYTYGLLPHLMHFSA